jgi:sodium/bile acid cotransporter 7
VQVVGQVIQNVFPTLTKILISWKLSKISPFCLLTIIWQTYDQAFESGAFQSLKSTNVIFIVFISLVYYIIWTCISVSLSILWLDKKDTIAVAYCVPAKTPAMGIPISAVMFSGLPTIAKSKIQIPMVIYQGFQIAAGSLMTMAFRRWLQLEEEREKREEGQERDDNAATG